MHGRIVFVSTRNTPNGELFTMAADGTNVQQLTSNANGDGQPSWLSLGNRIAFYGSRPAGQALYTVQSDGGDIQLLAPQALRPGAPAASLVGDGVVFAGFRPDSGYSEIMRIQADGSGLVLLTNNEVNFDYSPGWLPGW
jgi:TolB protein